MILVFACLLRAFETLESSVIEQSFGSGLISPGLIKAYGTGWAIRVWLECLSQFSNLSVSAMRAIFRLVAGQMKHLLALNFLCCDFMSNLLFFSL